MEKQKIRKAVTKILRNNGHTYGRIYSEAKKSFRIYNCPYIEYKVGQLVLQVPGVLNYRETFSNPDAGWHAIPAPIVTVYYA